MGYNLQVHISGIPAYNTITRVCYTLYNIQRRLYHLLLADDIEMP